MGLIESTKSKKYAQIGFLLIAASVTVRIKNEVWKMNIHKLDQVDGRNRRLSVQIYSFLEVTAVRYDEKADVKDGQYDVI